MGIVYIFVFIGQCLKETLELTDLSRDQEVSSITNGVFIHCRQVSLPGDAARQAFSHFKKLENKTIKKYGTTRKRRDPCSHQT
jgi:hypothetical protein